MLQVCKLRGLEVLDWGVYASQDCLFDPLVGTDTARVDLVVDVGVGVALLSR